MRIRLALAALFAAALALQPPSLHAQSTAAEDSAHWRATKLDLDSIARDRTAPAYSKRAQARIRLRDSLHAFKTVTPPVPPQPVAASIAIHSNGVSVAAGSTLQLSAEAKDASGTTVPNAVFSWSVTPDSVASISGAGLLTGKKSGTAQVVAKSGIVAGVRGYAVTGTSPPVPPDSIPPIKPDTTPVTPTDTTTPAAGFDGIAELPRALPTPVYSAPCAVSIAVTAAMDVQQAINMAAPGTCLLLAQGATYSVGTLNLPAKSGSAWITITTNGVQLPPPGTRMTPSRAASLRLAKISQSGYSPAIAVAASAHHYRFVGIEITPAATAQTSGVNMIVALYDQSATWSIAGLAHDLQFIQVYVHGSSTLDVKRCFRIDARYLVIVDSWISDCHSNQTDSQGWLALAGAANVLLRNNHVEGGHQAFMSGGGDPPDSSMSPRDIAIIGNHIYHPAGWKGVWQGKTVLETKNVRRLLIEGNVIENSWPDAQAGFCGLMKSENQSGGAPYTTTSDVVIAYNLWLRCGSVFNFSGTGSNAKPNIPMSRLSAHDNRADSVGKLTGDGIGVQLLSGAVDMQLRKNTIMNGLTGNYSNQGISFDGAPQKQLVFDGNIIGHGQYGVKGSGTGDGMTTLSQYAPGSVFTNNVLVGSNCGTYPASNSCGPTLPPPSATLGADMTALAQHIAGVVVLDPAMGASRARGAAPLKVKRPAPNLACQSAKDGPLPAICDRPIQP